LDVLLRCLLFPCIAHFHFIIVRIFFYWNLAVVITCYLNNKLTYQLRQLCVCNYLNFYLTTMQY